MSEPITLQLLERLVAFDPTGCNSSLALVAAVAGGLRRHGVASRRLSDASGTQGDLFATQAGPA